MTIFLIECVMIVMISIISEIRVNIRDIKIKKQRESLIFCNKLIEELSFAGNELLDDYTVFVKIVENNFGVENVNKMFNETKEELEKEGSINEYLNNLVKEYKNNNK